VFFSYFLLGGRMVLIQALIRQKMRKTDNLILLYVEKGDIEWRE